MLTMAISLGFRHGVHPPEEKELTSQLPIRRMPYPDELVLPLRQHAGKPAKLCVKVGDHVERGDMVGEADGFMSVPIHASAAGTVVDIDWWPHPDGIDGRGGAHQGRQVRAAGAAAAPRAALGRALDRARWCRPCRTPASSGSAARRSPRT